MEGTCGPVELLVYLDICASCVVLRFVIVDKLTNLIYLQ